MTVPPCVGGETLTGKGEKPLKRSILAKLEVKETRGFFEKKLPNKFGGQKTLSKGKKTIAPYNEVCSSYEQHPFLLY